jgi:hypothetical protein
MTFLQDLSVSLTELGDVIDRFDHFVDLFKTKAPTASSIQGKTASIMHPAAFEVHFVDGRSGFDRAGVSC